MKRALLVIDVQNEYFTGRMPVSYPAGSFDNILKAVDAAKLMEMTPQQLREAVKRIKAAHKAGQGTPEDWECVTVCVPPELVETVREVGRQAKRDAGLSVD